MNLDFIVGVRIMTMIPCPDCGGAKQILLFNLWHECDRCNGTGEIVDPAPLPPMNDDDTDYIFTGLMGW